MFLNRISAYISALAVYYVSYIPFLYILPYLGVDKITIFIIIVLSNLALIFAGELRRAISGRIRFEKHNVVVICLYTLFAVYALSSYAIIGEVLSDVFTIRTLTILNPIFILLAMSCLSYKRETIIATFVLSFVYFAFLIRSIIKGNVQIEQFNILSTVFHIDEPLDTYQNVNMYIGLFITSTLYFISQEKVYYTIFGYLVVIASFIGMFLVGGRASIIAVVVVLLVYLWKSNILGKRRKISSYSPVILFCWVVSAVGIAIYWNEISQFVGQSITMWRISILFENYDASGRIFLFTKALELFLTNSHTFLFGAGINSFPVYIGEYSKGMYPHNVLLELLCEYGIIGFVLFMAPVVYILFIRKRMLGTLYGNSVKENIVFLLGVYFWVHAMFTGDVGSSFVLVFFSFILLPSRIRKLWPDTKGIGSKATL